MFFEFSTESACILWKSTEFLWKSTEFLWKLQNFCSMLQKFCSFKFELTIQIFIAPGHVASAKKWKVCYLLRKSGCPVGGDGIIGENGGQDLKATVPSLDRCSGVKMYVFFAYIYPKRQFFFCAGTWILDTERESGQAPGATIFHIIPSPPVGERHRRIYLFKGRSANCRVQRNPNLRWVIAKNKLVRARAAKNCYKAVRK